MLTSLPSAPVPTDVAASGPALDLHVVGTPPAALPAAAALATLGHRVRTLAPTTAPRDSATAGMGALADRVQADWRDGVPDVVHALSWREGLACVVAARRLPEDRRPAVVQSLAELPPAGSGVSCRLAVLARAADRLLVPAGLVDAVLRLGARPAEVDVVPEPVDTAVFRPDGPAAPRSTGARVVVSAGPPPGDGRATAAAAVSRLRGVELVVLEERGPGADQERAAVLRSADVVVHVPANDPGTRLVVQALACGVPVVASDVGGAAEAVVEGATGVLVPPGRPELLAAAVQDLLTDPLRLEGYALAAVERARVRYGWSRVAEESARSYARALQDRSQLRR